MDTSCSILSAADVPVLGIEPAANVAKVAIEKGVPTQVRFFGVETATELAAEGRCADLVLGNNVLAQVPDLNDFVEGLKILLKPHGVLTLEFPHLLRLMEENQFDTIYHEHFSYFSMLTTVRILGAHGLKVFDVEELPTHGGSLRVYACRTEDKTREIAPSVEALIKLEKHAGQDSIAKAMKVSPRRCERANSHWWNFCSRRRERGKKVAGYGAPGKSATLLNYCGIEEGPDRIYRGPEPV